MDDKELEALVQELIAAGESEAVINSVIEQWDSQAPSQEMAPMASHDPNNPTPVTAGEKIKAGLRWAGNALGGAFMPGAGPELVKDAEEHPYLTAAGLAVPGVLAGAMKVGRPVVRETARVTADMLDNPLVGGGIGALEGYRRGGTQGAVAGAVMGAAGTTAISRGARGLHERLGAKPEHQPTAAGYDRYAPNAPASTTAAADDAAASVRMPASPIDRFMPNRPAPDAPMPSHEIVTLPESPFMVERYSPNLPADDLAAVGARTERVPYRAPEPATPPNPNAGGRLAPGSPRVTPEAAVQRALDDLRQANPGIVELAPSHPPGSVMATGPANENAIRQMLRVEGKQLVKKQREQKRERRQTDVDEQAAAFRGRGYADTASGNYENVGRQSPPGDFVNLPQAPVSELTRIDQILRQILARRGER